MSKLSHLDENKLRKLEEIKTAEIDPYPYNFDQTHQAREINEKYAKLKNEQHTRDHASVAGRIILKRVMGKASFFQIQDQSGKLQIYLTQDDLGEKQYHLFAKKTDTGDIIGVKGTIFKTRMGEVTVKASAIQFLAKSLIIMPEKFHGLKDEELRYRQRYVDLIVNPEVKDVFIKKAKIYRAIREFLHHRGFIEVQTPILQTEYGGANARPFLTKINAWDMKMYLRIAYELHLKRLIVGGFEKIFDLSSCFRNEDADRTHNPEFAMMEIQWAYADYNNAMKLTEELWESVAKTVLGTTIIGYQGKKIDLKAPWKRLTMKDALKTLAKIDVDKLSTEELYNLIRNYNIEYEGDIIRGTMIFRLFEELCEDKLIQPTHIIDHPKESCPLAKPHRKNPELIERVEPFINGLEVGNCYSELTDPFLQRKLLEEQAARRRGGDQEAHPLDEDYLRALEFGLPPNTGIGIGVDRMVLLLTGQESIRDVILFPTMKPKDIEEVGKEKETKFAVVILNSGAKLKKWQELNTVAHLNAAFAARKGHQLFLQDTVATKDKKEINLNIQNTIMIKQAASNQELLTLAKEAKELNLDVAEFTREMMETSDDKKVADITKTKNLKEIDFLGILVFGERSLVNKLTRKFGLYS
ncbi:lysine--tRNA ligase [Candidatus Woesearchaeota archaeon]|nr:lysine--tRNA ligase [Candidatus Woesearchaeota archaeon]